MRRRGARRSIRVALAAGLLAAAFAAFAAVPPPVLARRQGRLMLTRGPDILGQETVRQQLVSGLTTTFLFRVTVRDRHGHAARGAARVDLRYEPWEEVYHLAAVGVDGTVERRRLGSPEALSSWWRRPSLAIADSAGLEPADPWQARVELRLLPFSNAEEQDARRWLADSLGGAGRGDDRDVSGAAESGGRTVERVLDLLIATSLGRDPVAVFRWRLEVAAVERP